MTLDDVAAEIYGLLLDEFQSVPCKLRGEILAVVAKREAWVVDTFQAIRRTEKDANAAGASAFRAKSRRGANAARERESRLRSTVSRMERELGVDGMKPAGPIVSRGAEERRQ